MRQEPANTTRDIISLLKTYGEVDYIGEQVSQLEHSLQCAELASSAGADSQTIVAALLHDIGHFLPPETAKTVRGQALEDMKLAQANKTGSQNHPDSGSVGRVGHETIGECYLRSLGFPDKICALVGSHVAAKRYLTATDSTYYDTLSDASKRSLKFQGGPMTGDELDRWAKGPWCDEMCQLRKWDDAAKIVGWDVPQLDTYASHIERSLKA